MGMKLELFLQWNENISEILLTLMIPRNFNIEEITNLPVRKFTMWNFTVCDPQVICLSLVPTCVHSSFLECKSDWV
jgi:hypothetical protein